MRTVSQIIEIIRKEISANKALGRITDSHIAEILGTDRSTLSAWKARNSYSNSLPRFIEFAKKYNVSLDYLLDDAVNPDHGPLSIKESGREGESAKKTQINEGILTDAIKVTEEWLTEKKLAMNPGKKAQLIALLYEEIVEQEDNELAQRTIERFCKLAAA